MPLFIPNHTLLPIIYILFSFLFPLLGWLYLDLSAFNAKERLSLNLANPPTGNTCPLIRPDLFSPINVSNSKCLQDNILVSAFQSHRKTQTPLDGKPNDGHRQKSFYSETTFSFFIVSLPILFCIIVIFFSQFSFFFLFIFFSHPSFHFSHFLLNLFIHLNLVCF